MGASQWISLVTQRGKKPLQDIKWRRKLKRVNTAWGEEARTLSGDVYVCGPDDGIGL